MTGSPVSIPPRLPAGAASRCLSVKAACGAVTALGGSRESGPPQLAGEQIRRPQRFRVALVDAEAWQARYDAYALHQQAWTNGVACPEDCSFCRNITRKASSHK